VHNSAPSAVVRAGDEHAIRDAGARGRALSTVRMVGVGLALALPLVLVWAAPSWAANAISVEHALPGDPHWWRSTAPETSLEICASQISVVPGDTLRFARERQCGHAL
jgi:hypothetical protein